MFSLNDLLYMNGLHDRYKIADQDNADSDALYFGFLSSDGSWYILKQATDGDEINYRYCKGTSAYATAWDDRATQEYDYYANVFPS